jgi:catechol 2,3-dioxygenase-like lactoylglutathione lyase family enzyme
MADARIQILFRQRLKLSKITTGVAFVFEKVKLIVMLEITEVAETVLYVRDVERAEHWYQKLFGFPVIFREADRFRALKVGGVQVLLLFKEGSSTTAKALPGGIIPPHDGSGPMHLAFGMKTEDADHWEQHLIANGVAIESRVQWNKGHKSIYFRDPDNHLVELITSKHWSSQS